MAIGYLNLCHNNLSLESLRPITRAHVLELYLGKDLGADRLAILCLVPGVWVLDGEYVRDHERRVAEGLEHCEHDNVGVESLNGPVQVSKRALRQEANEHQDESKPDGDEYELRRMHNFSVYDSEFRDMTQQGHLIQEFFQTAVWKVPCR